MSKMFNKLSTSGATTVTEKLGLDSEVRELKFGSSFNPGNRGQSGAFHSIKYDFKPASVDKSKAATLEVGPNGQVSISMPHYDNTGSTVFKGSTRPYTKECVLIIDKDTGEIVLEKLSHNVQVKKTRQEGSGKNYSKETGNLPPTDAGPAPGRSSFNNNSQRNDYQSSRDRDEERDTSSNRGFSASKRPTPASTLNPPSNHGHGGRRSNSPLPPSGTGSSSRHSPLPSGHSPSPSSFETHPGGKSSAAAFDVLVSKQVNQNHAPTPPPPNVLSLTSLEDFLTTAPPVPQPPQSSHSNSSKKSGHHPTPTPLTVVPATQGNPGSMKHKHSSSGSSSDKKSSGGDTAMKFEKDLMSDSSDDSSSSSSSEEEDDDSSSASDMEDVALPPSIAGQGQAPIPMDTSSSRRNNIAPTPQAAAPARIPPPSNASGSMPNFFDLADNNMPSHVLSEDLQLSESGSSSDSD